MAAGLSGIPYYNGGFKTAMRNESTKVVLDLIKKDRNVVALTADNGNEIYDQIKAEYPEQYIDYGIAECNMVAAAAGMASAGKIPFLYAVTNFMSMRAYEFIRNLVCLPNYNVKFLGRSAGVVTGTYGMTHQGTEDLAILRTLPNLLVISPATPIEARAATRFAYEHQGSVYIRLEGHSEPELYDCAYEFQYGRGSIVRQGTDLTIITVGSIINEALKAAIALEKQGVQARIINMPMLRPVDTALILAAANETKHILTVEEHSLYGGLGSAVAEVLAEHACGIRFRRMGLEGYPKGCGNRDEMRALNGLTAAEILQNVTEMLN